MIPRRLRLRNFLSYRDCTVNLSGLQLAVLCGRNGDGKSALLDAMTWAVWGEARGRLEDDRIHVTEHEMLVDFEFESSGDLFQVIRKRTRARASGALDFFQIAPDGTRTALTGGTMTETQGEILRRVHMDYDTFANSAFVAQGRADEFTRRTPKDRKEIFRKVLGLERYEELSTGAGEHRKEAAQRLREVEANLEQARQDIERLPGVRTQLDQAHTRRESLRPAIAESEAAVADLRLVVADYARRQREADEAASRVDEARAAIATAGERIGELESELRGIEQTLQGREETIAGYQRLQALRIEEQELARRQGEAQACREAMANAESAIAQERARIEARAETLGRDVAAAEVSATALPRLEEDERACQLERQAIAEVEARAEQERALEKQLAELAASKRGEAARLRDEAQEIKNREDQLSEGLVNCPVCKQPLTPDRVSHVREEYAAHRRVLGERYRTALAEAEQVDRESSQRRETAGSLQAEARRRSEALQSRERELHGKLAAARQAAEALPSLMQTLSEVQSLLDSDGYALEERSRVTDARERLQTVGYDGDRHAAVREELDTLAGLEAKFAVIGRAEERKLACERSIARERDVLEERQAALAVLTLAARVAAEEIQATEDIAPRLASAEATLASLREQESELTRLTGALEQQVRQLTELSARVESGLDKARGLREEEQIFGDLARAFGRDGVQAMLIDQSLPRLQQSANDMLDRMTGGRIQLSLHTQRERARGGPVETLDIRISDDLGTRDYEMYSGGEAFRVDFALRIALAKLLAERSGAELPTLIIDEGFGSQDQEGIDRLVESITAISRDFRLILVVTHIDELRERFERRIEVTKDPERGSFARVV